LATSAGTISSTTANAPRRLHGERVLDEPLARVAAALDAETAQRVLRLRGEAQVRHHRDARRHHRLDVRREARPTLQLHGVRPGLLHEPDGGGEGLLGVHLVAAERQVGHHQRRRRPAYDGLDQRHELVDRHRDRVVVAVDVVACGIPDQ
jgi:hypothetical protein